MHIMKVKKLFFIAFALIVLVSGCKPAGQVDIGSENSDNESILDQFSGKELSFYELLESPEGSFKNFREIRIPVFETATLEIIPFPDEQGRLEKAGPLDGFVYCANDYLVGDLLTIGGRWINSELGDCEPNGEYSFRNVSGQRLLQWREQYQNGPPAKSILDELE